MTTESRTKKVPITPQIAAALLVSDAYVRGLIAIGESQVAAPDLVRQAEEIIRRDGREVTALAGTTARNRLVARRFIADMAGITLAGLLRYRDSAEGERVMCTLRDALDPDDDVTAGADPIIRSAALRAQRYVQGVN